MKNITKYIPTTKEAWGRFVPDDTQETALFGPEDHEAPIVNEPYFLTTKGRKIPLRIVDAAPELLTALKELQKQIHAHHKMNVKKDFSLMVADVAAQKAIAKAEGR